eukprot:GFUD01019410.1.p1 GENE.GFUD01019410.1~~GFUD01019410.1.p1  ORF type:complete len:522 (+),score=101.91 GFUD01019410.1:44-1609(+)
MAISCRNCFSHITVEPCLFLFALSHGLYVLIAQNLYIAKVCEVNLNFTKEICDDIINNKAEQLLVQKKVSELQAYNGILQALPAVVYALFAGPWSDKHGRRLLIVWSCFGYFLNNTVYIINTYWFYQLRAEYLLFEFLQDCTGGYVIFFLACYAYISDISTKENRTKRLAYLDGLFPAGFFTGMAVSGLIKEHLGYYGNFFLAILFSFLAMFYAIFFLKDSRTMRPPEVMKQIEMMKISAEVEEEKGPCVSLFDTKNLKSAFSTVFKQRENKIRTYILMLIACFILEIFLINGKGPTMYLYFRRKFNWDAKTFGSYIGLYGFLGMFAQYVAVPYMSEKLKLHDTTIALIAIAGVIIQHFIACFTPITMTYLIYIGGVISFLSVCITTTCRSLITKCITPLEIGKVFSVMGAFQAIVPLVASPAYGFIYKQTVATFPGVFLLFSAGLYVVVMVLLFAVNTGMRRSGVMDGEKEYTPENMEKLIEKRKEATSLGAERNSKIIVEMAPEGQRFKEVEVSIERKY